ncbi:MAG: AzlD domain-containing protein [Actinobacteria bacterium]|nr:AzlD domain-containing protein [Micrococcales bacterium]MCB9428419.1 AzlD domain-containing protein [Actinomycetota bacterium]
MCRPNAPQVRASCSSDIVGGTGQPCRRSREAHDDCVTITGRHSSWCRGRGGHDRCHHRRLRCVVRSAFHHVGIVGLADHGPERPDVHRRFAVRDGLRTRRRRFGGGCDREQWPARSAQPLLRAQDPTNPAALPGPVAAGGAPDHRRVHGHGFGPLRSPDAAPGPCFLVDRGQCVRAVEPGQSRGGTGRRQYRRSHPLGFGRRGAGGIPGSALAPDHRSTPAAGGGHRRRGGDRADAGPLPRPAGPVRCPGPVPVPAEDFVIWAAVLIGSAVAYTLKALGFVVPERMLDKPLVAQLVAMFPIALLSALLAVVTVADGMAVVIDARVAAVAAAAVALMLRAPFLVVVVVGAATAAFIRVF